MRLIDADALQATMYHEAFEKDSDLQKWDSGCWIRYKLFEKCIDAAPTIDVEALNVMAFNKGYNYAKAERASDGTD